MVAQGERYGHGEALDGLRINLEFVSANPTGPLHAGGGRWVAVGDAIANLLAAQGADRAPRVLPQRRRQPARHLRGVAVRALRGPRAARRTATRASTSSTWPRGMRAELGDAVTEEQARDWGYRYDRAQPAGRPRPHRCALRHLVLGAHAARARRGRRACSTTSRARGVVYEHDGATLAAHHRLRRPARPRARAQSDGSTTYLCNDIAYHRDKFDRGLGRTSIDIWGADHHGQVKSLQAGMEALGYPAGEPEVLLGQLVKLVKAGEQVRISKRTGNVDRARRHPRRGRPRRRAAHVPAAGHRHHADVRPRRRHRAVDGEPRLLRAVRARAHRVDRAQGRRGRCRRAARCSTRRPRAARARARARAAPRARGLPRRAAPRRPSCARRTASPPGCATSPSAFHGFYRDCRVISDDAALTQARLWLAEACRLGLASALAMLGVHAPDEMARLDDDDGARVVERRRADRPGAAAAHGDRRRRRTAGDRRRRPRGAGRASSARRCTSTTRTDLRARCREYRERVRCRRGVVRGQGVPLRGDGAPGGRGGAAPRRRDRRRAAASRSAPASRPSASCSTATTSPTPSSRWRCERGVGRIVADSVRRARPHRGARSRDGAARAAGARAGHARRRGAHPRVHRDRRRRLEVRLHRRRTARRRDAALRVVEVRGAATSPGSTATSVRRSSVLDSFARGRRGGRRSRGRRRARHRRRGPRDQPRWRARRPVHRRRARRPEHRRVRPGDERQLRRRLRDVRARPGAGAHRRGRPFDRRRPPASRSTPSARSRQIPGVRTYVAVDGGMSDNPRPGDLRRGLRGVPARPRSPRRARWWPPSRASTASRATCSCATPTCRPTSRSATSSSRRSPVRTATRWRRNYNKVPRPAVVFVRDGAGPGGRAARDVRRSRRSTLDA